MKSLEALENIVKRTAIPYLLGMYSNEDHIKDIKIIKEDLEVLEVLKKMFNEFKPDTYYWSSSKSYSIMINGEANISEKENNKFEKWLKDEVI